MKSLAVFGTLVLMIVPSFAQAGSNASSPELKNQCLSMAKQNYLNSLGGNQSNQDELASVLASVVPMCENTDLALSLIESYK